MMTFPTEWKNKKCSKPPISNPYATHGAGIFSYMWVIYGVNVGKYTSTMEHMGNRMREVETKHDIKCSFKNKHVGQ